MLPNKHRLRKQKDIERVWKEGKSSLANGLRVKVVFNKLGATRFCFIVPASIESRAAARNLFKRRLREAARCLLPRINSSYDIIIYLYRKPADISYASFFEALEKNLILAELAANET